LTKRKPKPPPSEDAIEPAPFDALESEALKALYNGVANAAQQKLGLEWIIRHASRYFDEPYRNEKSHDTSYACGRMSVGRRIIQAIEAPMSKLEQGESQ
jgi:hypothetical protein